MLARYSGKAAQDAYASNKTTTPPLPVTRVGKANLYDSATLREWLLKYHTTGGQN
jgi:hypothetical protein